MKLEVPRLVLLIILIFIFFLWFSSVGIGLLSISSPKSRKNVNLDINKESRLGQDIVYILFKCKVAVVDPEMFVNKSQLDVIVLVRKKVNKPTRVAKCKQKPCARSHQHTHCNVKRQKRML